MDEGGTSETNEGESPVVAYILATVALLVAACLMCLCLMCCAKCPEWRRKRRESLRKEKLLNDCHKVKFTSKFDSKGMSPSESCAICLEDFQEKETIIVCPCRHGYHKKCLTSWLIHSPCCPVCKASVSSNPIKSALPLSSEAATEATPLLN